MSSRTVKDGGQSAMKRRAVLAGAGLTALGGVGYVLTRQAPVDQASEASSASSAPASHGLSSSAPSATSPSPSSSSAPSVHQPGGKSLPSVESVVSEFKGRTPVYWGEHAPGVHSRFTPAPGSKQLALTFDACGGTALGYDAQLISLLRRERVKATLFINLRWATAHPDLLRQLASDPLFEIANHGHAHVPLSVTPRSAWGIPSTQSTEEIWHEIADNTLYLRQQGIKPAFMRPGTAFSDEIGAAIAARLGTPLVSYSVNGDGGATYPPAGVAAALSTAVSGDIVISHFNQPLSGTAAGYAAALPSLAAQGFTFVHLSEAITKA